MLTELCVCLLDPKNYLYFPTVVVFTLHNREMAEKDVTYSPSNLLFCEKATVVQKYVDDDDHLYM